MNDELTIEQAAREAGEYHSTMSRRLERGELRFIERDGRRFVERAELTKWLAERAAAGLGHEGLMVTHALARRTGVPVDKLLAGQLDDSQRKRVEKVLGRKLTTKSGSPRVSPAVQRHARKMREFMRSGLKACEEGTGSPHQIMAKLVEQFEELLHGLEAL